jgi:O-antigen biosynthesis protein
VPYTDHGETAPSFTVVICTRDRPELLDRCLAAVSKLDYPNFEVLVVDNASTDRRTFEVARHWSTRYSVEPIPGLSRARNHGVGECWSEIVAFIDDDEIPEVGWLHALTAEFSDPQVMAVTGRILPIISESNGRGVPIRFCNLDRGHQRQLVDRETPFWFEIANFGGIGDGGNMAFRRSAFDLWPGFDIRLGRGAIISGGEEHRAFFSLVARGYRIVYTPGAVVRHPSGATPAEVRLRGLSNRTAAVAYMALILMEEPSYRRATFKYFVQGILGRRRAWRYQQFEAKWSASPGSELLAATRGLLLGAKAHSARSVNIEKPQFEASQSGRAGEKGRLVAMPVPRTPR